MNQIVVEDEKLHRIWIEIMKAAEKKSMILYVQPGKYLFFIDLEKRIVANYKTFVKLLGEKLQTLEQKRFLYFLDDILSEICACLEGRNLTGKEEICIDWGMTTLTSVGKKKFSYNKNARSGGATSITQNKRVYVEKLTRFTIVDTDGLDVDVIADLAQNRSKTIIEINKIYLIRPLLLREQIIRFKQFKGSYTEGMVLVCPNFEAYKFDSLKIENWDALASEDPERIARDLIASFIIDKKIKSICPNWKPHDINQRILDKVLSKEISPIFFKNKNDGIFSMYIECRDWFANEFIHSFTQHGLVKSFAIYHRKTQLNGCFNIRGPASNRNVLKTLMQ